MESSSHGSHIPDQTAEELKRQGNTEKVLPRTGNFALRMGSERQDVSRAAEREQVAHAIHLPDVIYERDREKPQPSQPEASLQSWTHPPLVPRAAASHTERAAVSGAAFGNEVAQTGARPLSAAQEQRNQTPRPDVNRTETLSENSHQEGGIALEQGQRLVRDGAYAAVVDQHNHLVNNFAHGHEFMQEQAQERRRDPLASATPRPAASNPQRPQSAATQPPVPQQPIDHQQQFSGQTGPLSSPTPTSQQPTNSTFGAPTHYAPYTADNELPSGITQPPLPPGHSMYQDPQHLLAPARHKSSLKNPWIWILGVLLMAAFFGGAFIG